MQLDKSERMNKGKFNKRLFQYTGSVHPHTGQF